MKPYRSFASRFLSSGAATKVPVADAPLGAAVVRPSAAHPDPIRLATEGALTLRVSGAAHVGPGEEPEAAAERLAAFLGRRV